jgi:uncharacterized protein
MLCCAEVPPMTDPHHTRDISDFTLLRAPPLEIKLAGNGADQGVITGYASVAGGEPDSFGDVVAHSAFAATIADHRAAGTMPVMLWSHDMARPVGRWTEMKEDQRGLFVTGQLNLSTSAGVDAFNHLRSKDITGLSIGFRLPEGGVKYQADGSRLLTAIDLLEVSLVALPACSRARVSEVKSVPGSRQELFAFLHQAGLSRTASKTIAAVGWPALSGQDDETRFNPLQRRIEAALDELRAFNKPHRYR